MRIRPITYKTACEFVNEHHRHHRAPQGCKYCVGLVDENGVLHGVVIVGRPVARRLDDGLTAEITRCCTDGTKNACSMLYGAACRIAKEMGYERVITYIVSWETGVSLKSANFRYVGLAGGGSWDVPSRRRTADGKYPQEKKMMYERRLKC